MTTPDSANIAAGTNLPRVAPPPPPPPARPRPAAGVPVPTATPPANSPGDTVPVPVPARPPVVKQHDPEEPVKTKSKARTKSRVKADASGGITMPGGLRLTERDYQLLTFLARYRLATIGQLARQFDTSEGALRNRLPRLEKAGLLAWAYTGQTKPKVWTITDTGLKVAGVHLKAPQISWGTLRHTLGLVDLGITFEQAGELVVTEREIRAAATRDTPTARMRTAIDLRKHLDPDVDSSQAAARGYILPTPGKAWGHIPDMVLVRQPFDNGASGNIAIELELNRKTLADWKTILTAYRDSPQFAQTIYYITDGEVERGLTGTINALNAQDRIQVVRFTPIETTALPGT